MEEVVGQAVKYAAERDALLTRTMLVRATLDLYTFCRAAGRRKYSVAYGYGSPRTRSGAWRGQMREGRLPKEPPLCAPVATYCLELVSA